MNLGLSLSLGSTRRRKRSTSPENTIKSALKERHHIRAVRGGVGIFVQPYALINAQGTKVLHCNVINVEGQASGGWGLENINIAGLSDIEVYDLAFVPSDAFDPITLNGVIAVVEGFDPFQDTGEQVSS